MTLSGKRGGRGGDICYTLMVFRINKRQERIKSKLFSTIPHSEHWSHTRPQHHQNLHSSRHALPNTGALPISTPPTLISAQGVVRCQRHNPPNAKSTVRRSKAIPLTLAPSTKFMQTKTGANQDRPLGKWNTEGQPKHTLAPRQHPESLLTVNKTGR